MWSHFVLAGLLAAGTQAYAPIQWMQTPTQKFVLSPQFKSLVAPQKLMIKDQRDGTSPDVIPYFTVTPQNTITWDAMDWCIEASGDKVGDSVRINRCTGQSAQKWNWIPNGRGQQMIQLRNTNNCLAVDDREVSVELQECESKATDLWKFEVPAAFAMQDESASSFWSVTISASVLAALGTLSFSAWLWQQARTLAMSQGSVPLNADQGGLSLIQHPVISRTADATMKDFGAVPESPTRRVVITGMGMVTPLGNNVNDTWEAILAGKTGVKKLEDPKWEKMPTKIAAYVARGNGDGEFDGVDLLGKKEANQMAPFIQYAMVATNEAMDMAGWHPVAEEDMVRTGVSIGSGIGGIEEITETQEIFMERGVKKVSPRFIPKMLTNLAGGFVSMKHNAKGPNTAHVTACATGGHAIGDAFRFIRYGDADVMIAGGSEAAVEPLCVAGFNQMRALATDRNDEPEKASRPFDEERSGFVMGDGCGILVMEELEHARARGAKIIAEIRGVGFTGDAYHVTAPSGEGGRRAMEEALKQGGLETKDIQYVNAHGTSTPVGDKMELETIQGLFGGPDNTLQPIVTSTKGATGHMLGAAGAVEAIFTTLAVANDTIPPTLNLENPAVSDGIKHVVGEPLKTPIDAALSNSFGFGGTNSCILVTKPPA